MPVLTVNHTTIGGKTVTWTRTPAARGVYADEGWACDGCHDDGVGNREDANRHAASCRAR